jgi:hypothetical protein
VFASHFHYNWFNSGPFATSTIPTMATWLTGANLINDGTSFPGVVVTKLGNGMPFPEGQHLLDWLTNLPGALTNGKLPIYYTRHNVSALNSPTAQAWINLDSTCT